jgi:hypothetical protein
MMFAALSFIAYYRMLQMNQLHVRFSDLVLSKI